MADAAALWQQGQQAIRARRFDEARERFERLLRLQPSHFGARLLLASVHMFAYNSELSLTGRLALR